MNTDNGSLAFDFYLDNDRLQQTALQAERRIKGLTDTAISEGKRAEGSFNGMGTALAAIGGTAFLGMIGKEILDTTAKFEKFEIVLKNTLGEIEGQAALDMIAEFAATTPFQLDEVTDSFIRMANQGFVPTRDEMVLLGDLASSTGKSFNQLTEAMLDAQTGEFERLKEFGIKASSNGDKVTFSFKDQQTTVDKTNASIRDYILSLGELQGIQGANEKISQSLTGQISNLQDKLAAMYNEIGSGNDGILYGGVQGAAALIENYETVGKVLISLVAVYGAYKAAVIVTNAVSVLQSEIAYQQILANIGNTGATITLTTAEGVAAVAKSRLTAAQLALNKSILANPYALAIAALVGLAIVVYNVASAQTEAEKAQKRYSDAIEESNKQIDDEKSKSTSLLAIINDEGNSREFRNQKLAEFIALNPTILNGLTLENIKTAEGTAAINAYVAALETKIKTQVLDAELTESIKRSQAASRGTENLDWVDKANIAITTAISPGMGGAKAAELNAKNNNAVIAAEKELQNKLKEELNKVTGGDIKSTKTKSPIVKNAEYWENQVKTAKDSLKKLDPESKTYISERKKLLNQIEQGEAQSDKILGKKGPKGTAKKDTSDYEKDKLDAQKKALAEEQSLVRKGIEDKIKILEDGLKAEDITFQKQQELTEQSLIVKKQLIDYDLAQTIKGIDDEEKEFIKKAKKAGVKNPDLSSFKSLRSTATTKATSEKDALSVVDIQAEKEKLNELLSKFQDIKQQMSVLESDYNNDIERLNKGLLGAKTDAEKQQVQQSIDERKKQFEKSKSNLSVEELMASPDWTQLFGNLDNITTRELLKLKDKVEGEFGNMNLSPEDLETLRQKIKDITGEIGSRNPFLALSEAFKKYKGDSSKINFKDLAKNAADSIQAIGAVFDQVTGSLDKMGIKTTEQDKQVLEDVSGMLSGAGNIAMGIATGNPMAIIQGSIELISNGIDLIAGAKDRKLEKSIGRHREQVESLKLAYDDLERAIEKALGSNRYTAQKNLIENLKKQQVEYAAMAKAEGDKKKTDRDKVLEYEAGIKDNTNAVAEAVEKMREDILGMDVSSAANELGSAIIDAFAAGEDAAAAWGNKVNDIVGDVIRKMLIQKLVEEPVGNIINKYMAQWVDSEGNFLGFDAVMSTAIKMGDELSAIGPGLSAALEGLPDDIKKYITGDVSGANSNKTALSGSIKSVSEDTAGVISGQLNAMRINQADSISVLRNQLLALNQIATNTANLDGILFAMNTLVNGGRAKGFW